MIPVVSNPSSASGNSVSSLLWAHTAEAGKDIHVIITVRQNGDENNTCTFGGVPGHRVINWSGAEGALQRQDVYVFENPTPGVGNLEYTAPSSSATTAAVAFNVANGGPDPILGGFWQESPGIVATRQFYGWDTEGLIIAWSFSLDNGIGASVDQGVPITSVGGLAVNAISALLDTEESITFRKATGFVFTMGAYMIPPKSQSRTSGTYQVVFGGRIDLNALGVGVSGFAGLPYTQLYSTGRIGDIQLGAATWHSLKIKSSLPPGVGNQITVEFYKGGASDQISGIGSNKAIPTGISVTLSDLETEAELDGLELEQYKYERLSLRVINTGLGALPSGFSIVPSFLREPGVANEHLYGNSAKNFLGSSNVDEQWDRAPLHPLPLVWGNFPTSEKSLVGIECEVREFVVDYQTEVTLNPDHQYYLSKTNWNGATWDAPELQDGAGSSVDTEATLITNSLGTALARWRGVLPLSPGDFFAHSGFIRNAGSAVLRQAATIKIVPVVPGEMMVSGHTTGTNSYIAQVNASGSGDSSVILADESKHLLVIPPLTALGNFWKAKGEILAFEPSGPGVQTVVANLRKNLADSGIILSLTGTEQLKQVSGDVDFVEGDSLGEEFEFSSLIGGARQFWSIPGISAPVITPGTIIVVKNAGGDAIASFNFTAGGGLTPSPFSLVGGTQQVFNDVPPGSGYSFIEAPPVGWQLDGVVVSNGSPIDNISVGEGEVVTVTFTNSFIAPPIPVITGSGIYKLVPGKKNDTLWVDVDAGTTRDVKKPNPFVKTAIVGE